MPSILLTNFYDERSFGMTGDQLPNGFNVITLYEPGKQRIYSLVHKADYIIDGERFELIGSY